MWWCFNDLACSHCLRMLISFYTQAKHWTSIWYHINMRQDWAPVSDRGFSASSLKISLLLEPPAHHFSEWVMNASLYELSVLRVSRFWCFLPPAFVPFTWADEIRRGRFGSSLRHVNISSFMKKKKIHPSIHSFNSFCLSCGSHAVVCLYKLDPQ